MSRCLAASCSSSPQLVPTKNGAVGSHPSRANWSTSSSPPTSSPAAATPATARQPGWRAGAGAATGTCSGRMTGGCYPAPLRPVRLLSLGGGAPSRYLVALGGGGAPVADVEQGGEDDPEPVPPDQAAAGRVEQHVHQGREGQEDDAQQGQQERVEGGVDPGRSRHPQDEQRQAREEPGHQREETTHLVLLVWFPAANGVVRSVAAAGDPAGGPPGGAGGRPRPPPHPRPPPGGPPPAPPP